MKTLIFLLLLNTSIVMAQKNSKIENYSFGHNGIELVAKSKNSVVIISTFNSKMLIREDIARKVYTLYLEGKLETETQYTIFGLKANVTGNCIIRKKDSMVAIDFYYEKVAWHSGLVEYHKKSNDKKLVAK